MDKMSKHEWDQLIKIRSAALVLAELLGETPGDINVYWYNGAKRLEISGVECQGVPPQHTASIRFNEEGYEIATFDVGISGFNGATRLDCTTRASYPMVKLGLRLDGSQMNAAPYPNTASLHWARNIKGPWDAYKDLGIFDTFMYDEEHEYEEGSSFYYGPAYNLEEFKRLIEERIECDFEWVTYAV